jgi:putative transposase
MARGRGCIVAWLRSAAMPRKLTTRVTKTYAVIGIEDLNVRGMVRNHHLARAVSDGGFHEFRRQIEYKARL